MPIKRETKLKKMIDKRTAYIEKSTLELLAELTAVTDGGALFFEKMDPKHKLEIDWFDVGVTEAYDVYMRGLIKNPPNPRGPNIMLLSVPLKLAAEGTAEDICDYLLGRNKKHSQPTQSQPTQQPQSSPPPSDFNLDELNEKQREALSLFLLSQGGKR